MEGFWTVVQRLPWIPIVLTILAAVLGYGSNRWVRWMKVSEDRVFAFSLLGKIMAVALIILALILLVTLY